MKKGDKCNKTSDKNGGNYTECKNKKGDQLREKDLKPKKKKLVLKKTAAKPRPKPPPPPGMSQSVADALIKKANKARKTKAAPKKKNPKDFRLPAGHGGGGRPYDAASAAWIGGPPPLQNVSAITAATSASAPKAAPPAANYNMLRPELRKHIIGYIRGEEFSPSKMKKAQIDRMYGMIEDDEDFGEARRDRFDSHIEYGGEYRQGYFQDKYGDVIDSRYDRADTKFRKDTKTGFIKFLKAGGDSNRGVVSGKYDKKTMKELIDVFVNEY
jgi:hypothetical protein